MTDWPPTGGDPPTGSNRGSTGGTPGDHPPTSPSWAVPPSGSTSMPSSATGSTPVSHGGVSSPSRRGPFGSGMPREARLAITVIAALLIIGLVIGLIFWASSDDDSEDATPLVTTTTTTAVPATTTSPPPAVSVLPPPPPPAITTTISPTTTAAPGGYDPAALGSAVPLDVTGFPSQQRWEAMRQCQTGGSYTEVNDAGTHHGAYQFRPATWDELAGREYPSLVGVLPSEASPADQDRMAYALWQEFGSGRWPECRHTLDGTSPPTTAAATAPPTTAPPATVPPTTIPPTTVPPTTTPSAPATDGPPVPPAIDLSALPNPSTPTANTPRATTPPATTPPVTAPPATAPQLPTAAQWEQLRQCESNGDYTVRSANGLYYGAYQFDIATWNGVASRHASRLENVLPSEASRQDQDFLAQKLWDERGRQPWPVCGARHLPANPDL